MTMASPTALFPRTSSYLGFSQNLSSFAASPVSPASTHLPLPSLTIEANTRTRREDRTARHTRVRKKIEGTPERPRLCVYRSNKHLYVQVIDDSKMHTLAAASTMQKSISEEFQYSAGPTLEVAQKIGEAIAKSCLEKGITKVAFDRGGYPYHGRVKAIADAAREHGLVF
ncbi:hypothetical protein MLD38_038721 [Melastoma candidum]|uniref:Uncharacterized protein n=1 Tax=Melastoma candidum TaxID=119954 RepID=A0ACB9KZS5_9MYRT|nr:hypothetical protein MLD38_038721 [Melastoma candidum]